MIDGNAAALEQHLADEAKIEAKEAYQINLEQEFEETGAVIFDDCDGDSQEVNVLSCIERLIEREALDQLIVDLFDAFTRVGQEDVMAKAIAIKDAIVNEAIEQIEDQL